MSESQILRDLKAVFPGDDRDSREGLSRLREFLLRFDHPRTVFKGVIQLIESGDPLVATAETFLHRRHGHQFENWDYPVTLQSLIEPEEGRLLSLPPGSRRFSRYRQIIPEIVDLQLHRRFPRLLAELANRPNLFFSGVYYPQELEIANMEMISAMHGTFYVVHAELQVSGRIETAAVVLKPTDMALESIVTFSLQFIHRRLSPALRKKIGPIIAPTIVAIDDVYGILDLIPGKNGVEFLPRGIKTGTIQDLRGNEYPSDLDLGREEVLQIAREFAKQAVMAYYLRLYDRKPDQLMIQETDPRARAGQPRLQFAHIDFGRALKRNYALPWKRHYDPSRPALTFDVFEIPYFEAAAAFIYLPHFIPAKLRGELNPFDGEMRKTIVETFVLLTREIKSSANEILQLFRYLIGRQTQYRPAEVNDICVEPADVEEVYRSLLALDEPEEIIESILNLAYHEREGTAAIQIEGEDDDRGVYRRALLSGDRVTRLRDKPDGPYPYRLVDYRRLGRVSYDADHKTLTVHFGETPEKVIAHIERNFSRRLAGYIRQFPGDPRGVELEIFSDGAVVARKVSDEGRVGMKRKLHFPQDIMREINEAGSGFAPGAHVLAHVAEYKKSPASADYIEDEISKHQLIISNDLEGKEILQFVMANEPEGSPLRAAMAEMIEYLLANPDYLSDKDPYESINQLVLSLGRKHLNRLWPSGGAMIEEFLTKEFLEKIDVQVIPMLLLYEAVDLSHFVHLILTVRFADELGRRANLPADQLKLLQIAAILHDLNVLDPLFREVLMEPSGRLSRPILTAVLDRHDEIAVDQFEKYLAEKKIALPADVPAPTVLRILKNHHQESAGPTGRIQQILHLADNIAVFADRTRPDHWNRGFLRLEEIAPRWIDAQLERSMIDREIWEAAQGFFSDPRNQPLLRRLDRMSAFYPQCYSALQMAAALHLGLNPQHPNPMADLRERHGADRVNMIFGNLMKSGLSVRDKIKVLNRTDSIAPMLKNESVHSFAFINASAQPVQRVVELIVRFVSEGRTVILMGILPRVIKTYERFRGRYSPADGRREWEKVCVIAGERRLQFVTHSYPYEADFRMPFHKIIRTYREVKGLQEPFCLIPFERFIEAYAPTAEPETRVRKLEKASDVEELRGSDRVRAEAERYLKWETSQKNIPFDRRSKERFRRILLGGFTNRDVLLFYEETVHGDVPFKNALREVIGALHENPNYLSDRSVYYSIQELVRSLGQIHFYGDGAPAAAQGMRTFLQDHGLSSCAGLTALLDSLKPQFNFVKHQLSVSLQIAVLLGRMWEKSGGPKLSDEDWRIVCAGTLLHGSLLDDPALADYALSPEDISSNRALRHHLSGLQISIVSLIEKRPDLSGFLGKEERHRLMRLFDESWPIAPELLPFYLVQTGLIFGSFCDFSKVENWKRGKVEILPEDLEFLWEFLSREFQSLHLGAYPDLLTRLGSVMNEFCGKKGPEILNGYAAQTHSYVRLFNALSLAAELRYGLKARGFDLFHHVRTIYGADVGDCLIEGIMEADFPLREKVKFARKLRILAAAHAAEHLPPSHIQFLNTDHPLGVPPVQEVRAAIRDDHRRPAGSTLLVPSGDYDRTERMFLNLRLRLNPEEFQKVRRKAKFLVGENYPLLIKEKSLQKTDDFHQRISEFRARKRVSSRHIFVPAGELLDLGAPKDGTERKSNGPQGEKGLFAFRAWMRLFE